MESDIVEQLSGIVTMAPPVIMAVVLHEIAHGYVALFHGDNTAKSEGRLTLNPIAHIDLFGTIILPIIFYFSFGAPMGFAKPVPINPGKLNNPRRDMAFVAAAGPGMNFFLAVVSTLLLKLAAFVSYSSYCTAINLFPVKIFVCSHGGASSPEDASEILVALSLMLIFSIWINLILALINLIPILPADGGRILYSFLPPAVAIRYARMERWGFLLLFGLLLINPFNILSYTLLPVLIYLFEFLIIII